MTMDASQSEIEYLATEIITNQKPVSYHKFSRQLNIPISQAKTTLLEYYEKNKDKLTAQFIITGSNKTGKLIKLSQEESLETDVKKFESINCIHVYCVFKKSSVFSHNQLALEELKFPSSLSKIAQYEKNGMIIGPEIKEVIPQKSAPLPSSPAITTTTKKEKSSKDKNTPTTSLMSSYVSRKQQKNQPQVQPTRAGTLTYTSRKSESSVPAKRSHTEPTKPSYQYKSRKLETKQPKERIIVGDDADQEENEEEETPVKAVTTTSDLQRMFDDDDFTFSDDNEEAKVEEEPEVVEIEKEVEEVSPKEESPTEPPVPEPSLFVEEEESEDESTPEQQQQPELIQEEDAEGYIVTRKAKPVTKPVKAKKPITTSKSVKSTPDKKSKPKQASITSFFGIKKK
ncbi:hypothetical protein SBY92_005040 [Candida maltosa Xu316]